MHRVLIAEADADLRDRVASTLRHDGYDVVAVEDEASLARCLQEGLALHPRYPDVLISSLEVQIDVPVVRLDASVNLDALR